MTYKHFDSGDARFKLILNVAPRFGCSDGIGDALSNIATMSYTTPNSQFDVLMTQTQIRLLHQMLTAVVEDLDAEAIDSGMDAIRAETER